MRQAKDDFLTYVESRVKGGGVDGGGGGGGDGEPTSYKRMKKTIFLPKRVRSNWLAVFIINSVLWWKKKKKKKKKKIKK